MAQIPSVPRTPGPRSTENIHTDAKDRFAGIVWIQKDSDRSLEDYFSEYDHWEKYLETKSYSKRSYIAAYKGMIREYQNYLCIINIDDEETYYVVSKHLRSELELLEPYCTCITCNSSPFNPLKYLWCPYCTKCIKAGPGFASSEYVKQAKHLKQHPSDNTYLRKIRPMKILEYLILLIPIISILIMLMQ